MFLQKMKSLAAILFLSGLIIAAGMGLRSEVNAGPQPAAPPGETKAAPDVDRLLTVIPLRKLDAAETAAAITNTFGKGVIVAAIPEEHSLLVYTDAKTTKDIQVLLIKLGDSSGKRANLIKLDKTSDCRDAARVLTEVFNGPKPGATARVTIVPVPDENALVVYATPADTVTIRSLMKVPDEDSSGIARPERGATESPKQYAFSFRNTAWADVLEWYAKESGLTNVSTVKPTGTITMMPPKELKLTFAEITDLINESLMAQKLILIRRETTFLIHPADERIDPTLIPRIELGELKRRGKTELVQVVIPVPPESSQDLVPEIRKLLTPFGGATSVKGALVVLDTAGNASRIAEVIEILRN